MAFMSLDNKNEAKKNNKLMVHKESALKPLLTDSETQEENYDEEMTLLASLNLEALK